MAMNFGSNTNEYTGPVYNLPEISLEHHAVTADALSDGELLPDLPDLVVDMDLDAVFQEAESMFHQSHTKGVAVPFPTEVLGKQQTEDREKATTEL